MRKIRKNRWNENRKLQSLDPFNEFDPPGKYQDNYDLMAFLSIIKDRWREGIIELSEYEAEWDDPNSVDIFITGL